MPMKKYGMKHRYCPKRSKRSRQLDLRHSSKAERNARRRAAYRRKNR